MLNKIRKDDFKIVGIDWKIGKNFINWGVEGDETSENIELKAVHSIEINKQNKSRSGPYRLIEFMDD